MSLTTDLTAVTERPGAMAKVRYVRMSASKVRVVLDLIRGKRVEEALEILEFTERLAAKEVAKCLRSAVANAAHNEDIPAEELYVSVAFADEGPTIKRFRPRARGRAGRIHKQTCHITISVSRMTETELDELRSVAELKAKGRQQRSGSSRSTGGDRAARVAKSRAAAAETDEDAPEATEDAEVADAGASEDASASSSDKEPSGDAGASDKEPSGDAGASDKEPSGDAGASDKERSDAGAATDESDDSNDAGVEEEETETGDAGEEE